MPEESGQLLNTINTKLDVLISQHGQLAAGHADHEARLRVVETGQVEHRQQISEAIKDVGKLQDQQQSTDRWRYALPVGAISGVGGMLAGAAALISAARGGK